MKKDHHRMAVVVLLSAFLIQCSTTNKTEEGSGNYINYEKWMVDREEQRVLKGKPREMKQTKFGPVWDTITQTGRNDGTTIYRFDTAGNMIWYSYGYKLHEDSVETFSVSLAEYDSNGVQRRNITYADSTLSDIIAEGKMEMKKTGPGKYETEKEGSLYTSTDIYTFYKDGSMTREQQAEKKKTGVGTYWYQNGQLVHQRWESYKTSTQEKTGTMEMMYYYSPQGVLDSMVADPFRRRTVFTNNEQGDPIRTESTFFNPDTKGTARDYYYYSYKYDAKGNWIWRSEKHVNIPSLGNLNFDKEYKRAPYRIVIREFKY